MKYLLIGILGLVLCAGFTTAQDDLISEDVDSLDDDLGSSRAGSKTDDEVILREEEAIKLDGLNVAQIKQLREQSEKFTFQAEVNRMMKLIINSLYRNKEIYLRELISNASDALDKIRLLSLTDMTVLDTNAELSIRIKADKTSKMLHITDTGVGMTKQDLINNLGTIAKSGTAEFLSKMQDAANTQDLNDMIGQFGVGFYSAFLVADRVIVTTKHNDDKQYIWESDANSFSIVEDPRGDSLKRGTTVSLQLKPEAIDFLETDTISSLVKKYSQFINFPIYLWSSKTIQVEEPIEEDFEEPAKKKTEDPASDDEEDAGVEEEKDVPKTKKIDKTVWDWELVNSNKPIWSRKPADIDDEEYNEFYKSLTKDSADPLAKVHFVAEGEVTFKALLFIPTSQPSESFSKYGTKTDNIKLYVRRVFITDQFNDMMPNYLSFIQGVVDSDDLPLNVSRETLQQHKLIKVIKKKLVRKALDMMKKLPKEQMATFWKEYSTNIKLGIIEDAINRTRLSKLLLVNSSHGPEMTTLGEYVSRMKPDQDRIYYIAGLNRAELENSPFVERVLQKGLEVVYLVDSVDEYALSSLPEFEGKKFQNLAKEGFTLPSSSESGEANIKKQMAEFKPLTTWLENDGLKGEIVKAEISERLSKSPCALIASTFGWTGNMARLAVSNAHQKAADAQRTYYLTQKKTLEINPRHPLIKELARRVHEDKNDPKAKEMAVMLFKTAVLRSGYMLEETVDFAQSIENMMRHTLDLPADDDTFDDEEFAETDAPSNEDVEEIEDKDEDHDEL